MAASAAPKPIVEFVVAHGLHEIKFRTNTDTRISKVWDSYAKSRNFTSGDKAKYRLFRNRDECVRLSETVQSNHITDGTKLQVYELSEEERCTVTICDQNALHQTFDVYIEDDLEYWVDAFRTWAWSVQGVPPNSQLLEKFALYNCVSHKKVDLRKGTRPVTVDRFIVKEGLNGSSFISRATFLCLRCLPQTRPSPLSMTFWTWDGDSIAMEIDAETTLQEAANACTILLVGPTMFSTVPITSDRVVIFRNGCELDTKTKAGMLRCRSLGDGNHSDDDADGTASEKPGDGSGFPLKYVDVDYMTDLAAGGALQIAALRNRVPGHPALHMLSPEAFSDQSATPLYLAASRGNVESVAALLAWGADPTTTNCGGPDSAEFAAVLFGHEAVVRLMLRHGTGIVARGIAHAAMGKRLQQLVRETGGSRALTLGCYCACQSTCQRRLTLMTSPNENEKKLVAALSNIALIAAADRGHLGVVQALLEAGYPPEVQDDTGESALCVAAGKGHAAVVSALLAAGASPHHRSLDGETPLHAAALSGNAECVRLLLEAGADPDVQSDLLLSYDEMMRISSRNFRNPSELGEWFRRQPRSSRLLMMESAAILGGCSPVSLAVGVGWHDSTMLLLDAIGCTGKAPVSKAKADLLQNLLSIASGTGNMAMASMLLDRLQACGAASWTALTDAPPLAPSRRAASGAGSRCGTASRSATGTRTGRRGGGSDADGRNWDGTASAGDEMFDAPVDLIATERRQRGPQTYQKPGRRDPGAGGAVNGGEDMTALEMEKTARKARARAGRALQAAEAAAQQEQLRLERRRQQQQEQRQQQLLAKKQMQKEQQQQKQQQPAEARVAENAGLELQKYILQERQQLRKKLGLDQDADGGANATAAATAAQPTAPETNPGAAAGAPSDFQCRCCLRDDALDLPAASAAALGASSAAAGALKGGAAGAVRCQVDPEHAAVGPRQRRLVVRCSGGCQLDYHYPDCWRELEALMKAARPDYHGLKGPAGRSHAAGIPCWSPDCTGVVLSAVIMEGTTENPRFHKQFYTAPCAVQQRQQQQPCKRGKVPAGAAPPPATKAPADAPAQGGVGGLPGKSDPKQKHWQKQSWYEEYVDDEDDEAGGDESQEGGPEQAENGVEQGEEEKVAEGPRAAELVDLSAVKLVRLNRRQALAGLELEVEAPAAANGSGAGGATAMTLDDVEAAPLAEGGPGTAKARGKRGGGVKLALAELHLKADAAEDESAIDDGHLNARPEVQPPPPPPPQPPPSRPASGNAWKDAAALPFAIRPVWERDAAVDGNLTYGDRAAANSDSGSANYGPAQAGWSSAHQAAVSVMADAQPAPGGGAPRPPMTEEDFPSLTPVNPSQGEKAAGGAASDPIIRALQLLKVPGTDILTRHLLLEGPCLRHAYTVLFRGRCRIADAQLSAILDRYGGMTAFQSFEDGAAVAVSYRNEDTASAVAAGLGTGDALGLLGPGSLAGGGGLEVSCLLEFPTDNALAREMGQAERAAGGITGSGGRAEGKGLVDERKLNAGASPFVPKVRSASGAIAAVVPPSASPRSAAMPTTVGNNMGPKAGEGPAGSHSTSTVVARAEPHAILPRAAHVPLATASSSAPITTGDMSSSARSKNGDDVQGAISAPSKSATGAPATGAGVHDLMAEDTWAAPAADAASWADAFSPTCSRSDANLQPIAEVTNAGPAISRAAQPVPFRPAPTRVAFASMPVAVAPRPVLTAVATPTRVGATTAAPIQRSAVTEASMPMNTTTAAQAPVAAGHLVLAPAPALSAKVPTPPSLTASVTVPVMAAPEVPIPVATVMTTAPRSAASSRLDPATGPSVVPSPIRRMTPTSFDLDVPQRRPQQQPQPQQRYGVPEPVPVLMHDAPSGIIAPASTPTGASSCSPETFTPGLPATLQAPAPPTSARAMTPLPPPMSALNPGPALVRGQGQANVSMNGAVTAWPSALLLAKPWLAARPGMQTAPPAGPAAAAAAPTVRMAVAVCPARQGLQPSPYPTALQGSYMVAPPVGTTVVGQTAGGSATQPGWEASTALAGVPDDEGDADVLSDVLGLCLA